MKISVFLNLSKIFHLLTLTSLLCKNWNQWLIRKWRVFQIIKGVNWGLHCHEACIEQNVNDVLADSLCSFSRTHHKMKNTLKSQNRRLKHICKLKLIVQENELWRLINVKQITLKIVVRQTTDRNASSSQIWWGHRIQNNLPPISQEHIYQEREHLWHVYQEAEVPQ